MNWYLQLTEKFRRKLEQMAQYTEKAQEALVLASEAAEDMGSPVIGTEHILVGLIEEGSGTAAMVLEANEVKLDRLLALVEQLVSSYQNTATKERTATLQVRDMCWKTAIKRLSGSMRR